MLGSHDNHNAKIGDSPDNPYHVSRVLTGLAIGGVVAGAAIILAPHVLPALGIGSTAMAEESMFVLHTSVDAGGSGLAGVINSALSAVPVIGEKLAEGGLFNAAATASIGIGGVLLGNFIAKREDGTKRIKWGNVIKYGALITSALVALPTVLTAISTGLIFLSTLTNVHVANGVIAAVDGTLGVAGNMAKTMMGFSGIGAVIPHFLTCGSALLPAALSFSLDREEEKKTAAHYSDGSVTLHVDAPRLEENKPASATLMLRRADNGAAIISDDLAVVHTKKLHLFVVDSSLKDYHHIHPVPTGTPGEYSFTFTPRTKNDYSAWADITLIGNNQNHKLQAALPSTTRRRIPPAIKKNTKAVLGDLTFDWHCNDTLAAGKPVIVEATVRDANGNIVKDLDPVMGAFAHLVGFGADGKSIVHTHPMGREPSSDTDRGEGKLRFHVEPNFSGPAQFYLQVKRGGQEMFAPFGQTIAPKTTAKAYAAPVGHGSHTPGYQR